MMLAAVLYGTERSTVPNIIQVVFAVENVNKFSDRGPDVDDDFILTVHFFFLNFLNDTI